MGFFPDTLFPKSRVSVKTVPTPISKPKETFASLVTSPFAAKNIPKEITSQPIPVKPTVYPTQSRVAQFGQALGQAPKNVVTKAIPSALSFIDRTGKALTTLAGGVVSVPLSVALTDRTPKKVVSDLLDYTAANWSGKADFIHDAAHGVVKSDLPLPVKIATLAGMGASQFGNPAYFIPFEKALGALAELTLTKRILTPIETADLARIITEAPGGKKLPPSIVDEIVKYPDKRELVDAARKGTLLGEETKARIPGTEPFVKEGTTLRGVMLKVEAPKIAPKQLLGGETPRSTDIVPTASPKAVSGATEPIGQELQVLAQEVQKYGSAEEFVNAQPKLYHAGTADIKAVDTGKSNFSKTFYLSDNADYAKSFGGKDSVINEMTLDSKANIIDLRNPSEQQIQSITDRIAIEKAKNAKYGEGFSFYPYSEKDVIQGIRDGKAHFAELPGIKKILKDLGYDGQITAESEFGSNYGIWNKDVLKTKFQLTDFYNQVNQTPEVKPTETTQKASGIAKKIEASAIEKGLIESTGELASYNPRVVKEQAAKIADLINSDLARARRMILGEEVVPQDMSGAYLVNAMNDYATKTKDAGLLLDLINSPIVSEGSVHGSELRMMAEMNPDSALASIQKVKRAREVAVSKKYKNKSVTKAKKKVVEDIKKAIKTPKKQDWKAFVESIKC